MFQEVILNIAQGAEILCVGIDPEGQVSLWEKHPVDAPFETKRITPVHTGAIVDITPQQKYIGTVVQHQIVSHFFVDLGPANTEQS